MVSGGEMDTMCCYPLLPFFFFLYRSTAAMELKEHKIVTARVRQ